MSGQANYYYKYFMMSDFNLSVIQHAFHQLHSTKPLQTIQIIIVGTPVSVYSMVLIIC